MAKDKKKLKPKEKEFARKYVKNNKNGSKTVKEVYGITDDKYAGVKANRLIEKDSVNELIEKETLSLQQALIKKGITAEKIAERVGDLLDATTPIFKNNNATKKVEQVAEVKDYTAIDKGLKHATAIFGVEDPNKPKDKNVYNFFYQPTFQEGLRNYDQNFKDQLIQAQNVKEVKTIEPNVEVSE